MREGDQSLCVRFPDHMTPRLTHSRSLSQARRSAQSTAEAGGSSPSRSTKPPARESDGDFLNERFGQSLGLRRVAVKE
jgi:hypothetical protein